MSSTNLNIGIHTAANLGGLNQTVAAINQVTSAQTGMNSAAAKFVPPRAGYLAARNAFTSGTPPPPTTPFSAGRPAPFGAGIGQQVAGATLGGLGLPTSIAGAVATGIGFVKMLTDAAGRVRDLSEQLNLTTTQFQHLEQGASAAGVPLGKLVASLGRMDEQRQAAAEGNEKLRAAFAAVGISLAALNDPTLQAIDLQQRLAKATENGTQAQRDAVRAILGAQGARLLPAFAAAAALAEKDAVSPAALASVDASGKAWERTFRQIKHWGIEAFAAILDGKDRLFLKAVGGKDAPDPRPNLQRDTKEYDEQIASGRSEGAVTGGAKRVRDFKAHRAAQYEAALAAERAMEQAKRDLDNTDDPERQAEFIDEGVKQKALRDQARKEYGRSYEDFARPPAPPPSAGAPLYEDQAASARKLEVDRLLTENAEKRRKLEFDQLTPAQKRADIEKRIAENKFALAGEDPLYDPKLKAELEGKQIDLVGELAGLAAMDKGDKGTFNTPADQFQKMGGFIGNAAVDIQQDTAREGVQLTREVKEAINQLPGRIVAAGAGNIQPVRITQ